MLREVLRGRVKDGTILCLIGKWLNAGVIEGEALIYPDKWTPQGGVIYPILANVFLQHVLDEGYVREVKTRLKRRSFLMRFADDFIACFEYEEDARRFLVELAERLAAFDREV